MQARAREQTVMWRITTVVNMIVLGAAIAILAARLLAPPDRPSSNDSRRERPVYRRANA